MPRTYYVHLDHNIGLSGSHVHRLNSHTILVSLSHYSLIYTLPGGANVVSISRICIVLSDLYQQETWKVKFVLVGPPQASLRPDLVSGSAITLTLCKSESHAVVVTARGL
jgi:hypothetical protein